MNLFKKPQKPEEPTDMIMDALESWGYDNPEGFAYFVDGVISMSTNKDTVIVPEEMQKLRAYLDGAGIEWTDMTDGVGLGVIVRTWFNIEDAMWSVIAGPHTYGGRHGLLEAFQLNGEEEPYGWLTAAEAVKLILPPED